MMSSYYVHHTERRLIHGLHKRKQLTKKEKQQQQQQKHTDRQPNETLGR